jgi:simple sugar transport system permease protein
MEFAEGLAAAAVRISIPILLVVVGEIVAERAGVLNVGLEGMILAGAFGAFAGAWAFGGAFPGVLTGVLAGVLVAALFAGLVLPGRLDPIVTGVALNILALGVTGVLYRAIAGKGGATIFVSTLPVWSVPGLSKLPIVGPAFFQQNALGWAAVFAVAATWAFLHRTAAGLVVRAAGENPEAVETAGVDVVRVRALAVLFGGVAAGAAGAYLSIGYSNTFVENMSAGRGFVALAIVVLARWNPIGAAGGALLFGLAMALQVRLQGRDLFGGEIPYQFFQMLPYALTLVALAGTSRRGAGAPAALARPFRRSR